MANVSNLYNNSNDPYGYGFIVNGADQAKQAATQGYNQALGFLQQGQSQGIGALQNYYQQAQNAYAPQLQASYGALDKYMDLLGMPRYSQGSSAYNAAQGQIQDYQKQIGNVSSQLKGIMDARSSVAAELASLRQQKANPGISGSDKNAVTQKIIDAQNRQAQLYSAQTNAQISQLTAKQQDLSSKYQQFQQSDPRLQMTDPAQQQQAQLAALQQTPGYQFNLDQGTQAIQNSAAAKGLLSSGATLKQIGQYSSGLAANTYNNAVNQAGAAAGSLGQFATLQSNNAMQTGTNSAGIYTGTAGAQSNAATGYGSDMGNIALSQAAALESIYQAQRQNQMAQQASQNYSNAYRSGLTGGV